MIKTVTITGADDSIAPETILSISDRFPFVEWGILVSRTSSGLRRFPSLRWIDRLVELNNQRIINNQGSIKLSMHLCGAYVKELLSGNHEFIDDELDDVWNAFARVQINTHAADYIIKYDDMLKSLMEFPDKEFIIQYDGVNGERIIQSIHEDVKFSALFDLSHGAGTLPESWPDLLPRIKCGYAGGIGPDNIADQIALINSKVGSVDTWIDMETKVRSANDLIFDAYKVERCLKISAQFIK